MRAESPFMNLNPPEANPTPAPCVMVIFGATGDLTKRKLIPALCNLALDNLLPKQFAIVGFATNDYTTESFRKMLGEEIPKYASAPVDVKTWEWLSQQIYYVRGDFQDAEAYKRLKEQVEEADKIHNTLGNRFFYLAVAPRFFSPIAKMLGGCGLTKEENGRWARVIIACAFAGAPGGRCEHSPASSRSRRSRRYRVTARPIWLSINCAPRTASIRSTR